MVTGGLRWHGDNGSWWRERKKEAAAAGGGERVRDQP